MKSLMKPGPFRETRGTQENSKPDTVRFAISFSPEDYERIKAIARHEGIPVAAAARALTQLGLSAHEATLAARGVRLVPTSPADGG